MTTYTSTILITGGTQGLGYQTAQHLAAQHPSSQIILASRTDPSNAADTINTALNQQNCIFLPLDLSSLSNIRDFANTHFPPSQPKYPPISHLLLNAGLQLPSAAIHWTTNPSPSDPSKEEKIETQFFIHHIGHTLLYHLLTPHLTPTARTVVVSSGAHDPDQKWPGLTPHYTGAEEVARPDEAAQKERGIGGRDRYATSKVANVLWTYALVRRLEKAASQRTVVSFDPGAMPTTGLTRHAPYLEKKIINSLGLVSASVMRRLWRENVHSAEESGESLAWVAALERGTSGVYYEGRIVKGSSVVSRDEGKQEELWEWTVKFVGRDEEERQRFGQGV